MEEEKSLSIVEKQSEQMGILAPAMLEAAKDYARTMWKSGFLPKHYKDQGENGIEAIVIALQYGSQFGFKSMTSLQNIAVINGMPSLKGDAAKSLIMQSGLVESWEESYEGEEYTDSWKHVIKVKRKGQAARTETFSVVDAKRAGLWVEESADWKKKSGPWYKYPKRMMAYRNLGFVARDVFPDVMQGAVTAEEAQDYPEGEVVIQDVEGKVIDVKTKSSEATDKAVEKALAKTHKSNSAPKMKVVEEAEEMVELDPLVAARPEEEPISVPEEPMEEHNLAENPVEVEPEVMTAEEVEPEDEDPGLIWKSEWKVYTDKELLNLGSAKEVLKIIEDRSIVSLIPEEGKNTNMKLRKVVLKHQEMCKPLMESAPDTEVPAEEEVQEEAPKTDEGGQQEPVVATEEIQEQVAAAIDMLNEPGEDGRDFTDMSEVWHALSGDVIELSTQGALDVIEALGLSYSGKEDLAKTATLEDLSKVFVHVLSN